MPRRLSEIQLRELFRNGKFEGELRAASGKRVEILRTGEVNPDSGPDFKQGLVRINGILMRGDIELHRSSSDWYAHNHHTDRNYNSVILHVVALCDDTRSCFTEAGRRIETLELGRYLSGDADDFLERIGLKGETPPLRCSGDTRKLSVEAKVRYLTDLGQERFTHKVLRFEERLQDIVDENRPVVFEAKENYFRDLSKVLIEHRKYDERELQSEKYWDQLVYEGIMEGLGYSKNSVPFGKLARNLTLEFIRRYSEMGETAIEAALFGAANLIPKAGAGFDSESADYCGRLNETWEWMRKSYKRGYVDLSEWFFFKLRPQNFPTVRLAAAAQILKNHLADKPFANLISDACSGSDKTFLDSWRKILVISSSGYWKNHFVFGTPAETDVRTLVGVGRAEEIIINTILPATHLRGRIFHDEPMMRRGLRIFIEHPPISDNMITLAVKEALFDGDNIIPTAAAQQGAIHLYRTLCVEKKCERCRIWKTLHGKNAA